MNDKLKGLLYGGAVGDALGAPAEFKKRGTFPRIINMLPTQHFGLEKGSWTDDTSMFLCLLESMLRSNGNDPKDQLEIYSKWFKNGYLSVNGTCFDIGNATRAAIKDYLTSGQLKATYSDRSAGNGSLMRIGAIPLFFKGNTPKEQVAQICADSSYTTHSHPECVLACYFYGGLIHDALNTTDKKRLLNHEWLQVCERWAKENNIVAPETLKVIHGSYLKKSPNEISTSGYAVSSLEASLYALVNTNSYEDGCILLANMGDDSDTVCCIYGYLAGALYGYHSIPTIWIACLQKKDIFEGFEKRLFLDK